MQESRKAIRNIHRSHLNSRKHHGIILLEHVALLIPDRLFACPAENPSKHSFGKDLASLQVGRTAMPERGCTPCPGGSRLFQETGSVFFSSRRRHTRFDCDWSSDVCSSD